MEYEVIYHAARDAGMDATLILVILIILAFLSCTGILAILINKLFKNMEARSVARQEEASKNSYERQMLRGLSHDRLVYLSKRYLKAGEITIEEYENVVKYLYDPYKGLGGNGKVDRLIEEVKKLRIVQHDILREHEVRENPKPGKRPIHSNFNYD